MTWLTTQNAADELDVSTRTIERWRRSGYLVPERRTSGDHSRYSKEQICQIKAKRQLEQMMS
jgi:DNA-binding transcriptional MerR regulator